MQLISRCGLCVLVAALGVGNPRAQDGEEKPGVPDDGALEAAGAVVGDITVHAGSIFDTEDPKEDRKIFRAANKLHVTTRDRVILRQLTFAPGDKYSRAALDESERLLRHNGYLYDAKIRPVSYDGNKVEIGVWTRDVWTLRPAVGFHRSGGVNTLHFALRDANFLGFGKSLEVERVNGVDRTQTILSYLDPGLFGSHSRLSLAYANNSDGSGGIVGFERPFWRREEAWGAGVRGETNDRTDYRYALGAITDRFQEQLTQAKAFYGKRLGAAGARTTKRLLLGYTYDRSLFEAIPGMTGVLPADRTLSYPWIGVGFLRDGFVKARDMDKLGRTEDLNLGMEASASLGFSSTAFGADRSAAMVDLRWHNGFNPGQGQMVTLNATANGRVTGDGVVEDGRLDASARYYLRDSSFSLFYMSVTGAGAANLDADHQLLLGGDNGLRGYPLRYATGDRSLLLTVEERFYIDREFFHVLRLGAAVFADVGKAWSESPVPAAHLGLLKDIGFGLRFGQTRSAHASVVRLDVAVPFDMPGGGFHPQILVTTGETF